MMAPDGGESEHMERRALAAEARASELLAEVNRLQALLAEGTSTAGAIVRKAPMLSSQTGSGSPAVPPGRREPSAEPDPQSTGWGLGAWGLDTVKHVAAVALETTGAAPAATAANGAATAPPTPLAHRWSRFASLCVDGTRRQCICLADAKGCQVWDVEDPASIRSLAQLHLRGVSCIAPLHTEDPRLDEGNALSDPSILAVGATDDTEGSSTLAFYSLDRGEFVQVNPDELASIQTAVDRLFAGDGVYEEQHCGPAAEPPAVAEAALDDVPLPGSTALQIRMPGPVCELISATPYLVVAIEGAVALLDSCTVMPALGQRLRVAAALPPPATEPQHATMAVAASAEWLAYAEPAESGSNSTGAGSEPQDAAQEEMSLSSAFTAATGMGSRLLDAVTQPDDGHETPRQGSAGVVVLEGLHRSGLDEARPPVRVRFTAHRSSPISALRFDKTGRLLVTASKGGKTLKVFQIPRWPAEDGIEHVPAGGLEAAPHVETETGPRIATSTIQPVLLYTLTRGTFMDAEICSISFSDDSLFVAVATSHGTAHVFAISPFGGTVDAVTHGIGNLEAESAVSMFARDQRLQHQGQQPPHGSSVHSKFAEAETEKTVPNLMAVARVKRSWIPSHVVTQGFPESQTATHYTIRCSTHSGASWEVSKRYSELAALKSQLESQASTSDALNHIAKNAEFPAKTWGLGSWGKLDESTIKARKEKLQLWLGNVLQYCVNEPAVTEFLRPNTLGDRAPVSSRFAHEVGEDSRDGGELATEWPIRVEFVKTENKSDGTLLPMAVNFIKPGGGRLIDANGDERVARESFMVFGDCQLSLHHILMDIAVTISDGGERQLRNADWCR